MSILTGLVPTVSFSAHAAPFVDWFGVTTFDEALEIRSLTFEKPILILEILENSNVPVAAQANLTASIFSLSYARHLNSLLKEHSLRMEGHIEIDTGMNRSGILARKGKTCEAVSEAAEIYALSNLHITGIYTHFACPDATQGTDLQFTLEQWDTFSSLCRRLKDSGYDLGLRHCSSSAALLCHPEFNLDMVRVGMLGLGLSNTEENIGRFGLQPILTWYAKILSIRQVSSGESIGYDRTYLAKRDTLLALISVGYADGYGRMFSNRAHVLIRGKSAPVCGKICMDCMTVDVTEIPDCKSGDPVILLGESGDARISANKLSHFIPYGVSGAVTCGIHARVKKYYTYHGIRLQQG